MYLAAKRLNCFIFSFSFKNEQHLCAYLILIFSEVQNHVRLNDLSSLVWEFKTGINESVYWYFVLGKTFCIPITKTKTRNTRSKVPAGWLKTGFWFLCLYVCIWWQPLSKWMRWPFSSLTKWSIFLYVYGFLGFTCISAFWLTR